MPSSSRVNGAPTELDRLRPYTFHGVDLTVSGNQATGDCPFCGRDGKFSVDTESGLWRCWVCGGGVGSGGGNGLTFTRLIYERAAAAILATGKAFLEEVAADRQLLSPATVAAWGVAIAPDYTWLVPGYGTDGRLDQVYRRTRFEDGWRLLPTPGIWPEGKAHALHLPARNFDPTCQTVYVCEGPWDGMALWEITKAIGANCQIIAVPGCNAWRDDWTLFLKGKDVVLLFDSDHPREYGNNRVSRAGYDGMIRVAKRLSGAAASVRYLRWGPGGYDPDKPSGWDVRDHLAQAGDNRVLREQLLSDLFSRIEDTPPEWFNPNVVMVNGHSHNGSVEALACSSWDVCDEAWKEAMQWRAELSDAMAVLLAVCASTSQAGNQLFLDLIGSPGSAKTTMCRALLVSSSCIHLENVTKIISGFVKPGDSEKDCSFLARANNKTWVTCEFDTLANLPQYHELMGKIRRIFDGETTATYGNSDVDRIYTALRTPWLRAGTPRMMDHDQSQLGDRFLRYIINDPSKDEKRSIVKAALRAERSALVEQASAASCSILDAKTRRAYALTGGYVDWLRANVEQLLPTINVSEEAEEYCVDLAELSADLRARPTDDKKKVESYDVKELPTRLARQNIRLATCLAVVLNKKEVDSKVLSILRKVAFDTANGHSLKIVQWLCAPDPKNDYKLHQETGGFGSKQIEVWLSMTPERATRYLTFLRNMDIIEWRSITQSHGAWVLTDRVYDLYLKVMRN